MDAPRSTGFRPVWVALRVGAAVAALVALAGAGPTLLDGVRPPTDPLARDLSLAAATLGSGLAVAAAGQWMPTVLRWAALPLPFVTGIAWVKTTPSLAASVIGTLAVAATIALCCGAPIVTWLVRRDHRLQEGSMDAASRRTRIRVVGAISLALTAVFLAYTARAIPDAVDSGIIGVYVFRVLIVASWPVLVLGGWTMTHSRSALT